MMKRLVLICFALLCLPAWAQATTYYISPTGSNSNNGLTSGAPFLTFVYALDPTRASCGDTLNLLNGVYGDGTSTGKISLSGRVCTAGSPLTIRALNSRQARIHDNGLGHAIHLTSSTAYIIFDGIVANSTNLNNYPASTGFPFQATETNNITIKNSVFYNPNKYNNSHPIQFQTSRDGLVEDTEVYEYHRHGILFFTSQRMVARRVYGHPRLGRIAGGFSTQPGGLGSLQGPAGTAGMLVSFYPCTDCILENGIEEGNGDLAELNAPFYGSVLMKGTKILGSIHYGGNFGNGIYSNGRDTAGPQYSPTNITIDHVAIVERAGASACLKNQDPVNVTINHVTCLGSGATGPAFANTDVAGLGATTMSFTLTNSIAKGWGGTGFSVEGTIQSWSGNKLYSNGNGTAFSPALPSNWNTGVNSNTTDPGLGTCYAWVPDGAAAKGAGTGGSDIGATILYRYKNGVLTNVPLWDPTTGEFPHGALVAGLNDVAGQSLFDVHKRLNINRNGCSFPANYGAGIIDAEAPIAPTNLSVF